MESSSSPGDLVEVAVSLPVRGTYTYRDPRRARPDVTPLAVGTQVVVPFGPRTVTGFVIGHPDEAPENVRDIEAVVDPDPLLDEEVLSLCRWAARYYLSPIGEVLRTALPQGERVTAQRRVCLSEQGERWLALQRVGKDDMRALSLDASERALLLRLGKVSSLSLRVLQRTPAIGATRIDRLLREGWIEVGDEVSARGQGPIEKIALANPEAAAQLMGLGRAQAQRLLLERLCAAEGGVPLSPMSPREKVALRALVQRGLARVEERLAALDRAAPTATPLPVLNAGQAAALSALTAELGDAFAPFLLEGITGSGKTEVYLRLIAEARARGRGALVLVPEIALTPQLAARFRARFGDDVAVLHSALPRGERLAAWRRLREGQMGIALGARSAVFAPVRNLGVVVVDEEHDPSFKQDDGVRYHGRDLAIVRAQSAGAVAVLGSATPSLESFRNALSGKYTRLRLPERAAPGAAGRPLPAVEVLDLRQRRTGPDGLFAPPLVEAVNRTLEAGDQVILFLNRRGFATVLLCRTCGHVLRCPDCDVSFTYHRERDQAACHYCGRAQRSPSRCPQCKQPGLEQLGTGTERVEAIVRQLFPTARVARLDRDTADKPAEAVLDGFTGPGRGLHAILERVHARAIDILVGTQMVTKGHDFPGVTLVGVLQPDQGMHLPDFRAAERTFQLLEQVAGRAGRAEKPGRVLVQTYNPGHPAIQHLVRHDFEGFARQELESRRAASYPPFSRLLAVRIDGTDAGDVVAVAAEVAARARNAAAGEVRVMGPAEAPIPRLRGRLRHQVWLAGDRAAALARVALLASEGVTRGDVRLAVDVDPQSVL